MGFIKFSKSEDIKADSKTETTIPELSRMQKGSSVDFDSKTYTVTVYTEFDWGDGFITQEWELSNPFGKKYLEREIGEEVIWILSDKAESTAINKIIKHMKKNEDPPTKITLSKIDFFLNDSGAGHFYVNGKRPGKECIMWSYTDQDNASFFSIYQWGDTKFTSYKGQLVKEQQFTNISYGKSPN